jgi:hypothetical protein
MTNEIGRELKANELKPATIVVLAKAGRPSSTMWVSRIGQDYVMFYAGQLRLTLIAHLREDGTLADDSGIQLHVYEYLGEP